MPQYPRKTRQMSIVAGVKPPIYAGRLYDSGGNFLSKTQYISKGISGSWPGPGWHSLSATSTEVAPPVVPQAKVESKSPPKKF